MNRKETFIKASHGGLKMLAYPGDDAVLLAFDLDAEPGADFAGFAIKCTPPQGRPYYLYNRLNLTKAIRLLPRPRSASPPLLMMRLSRNSAGYTCLKKSKPRLCI